MFVYIWPVLFSQISQLYGMRSIDLRYFMIFSFFLIPAFWVIDIFLFNLEELLWSWKLFEYIQFCNERFKNRSRRWIGLDDTINEELPADLRALDQMCLSVQYFMLGSLHAVGIVLSVLGYMLVLHRGHNIFGDSMVIPIFMIFLVAYDIGKRFVFRIADRWRIWMVEGELDFVEVYDEGPGSRKTGSLPEGMAAVDASIADCIEDTFAAGYTEDHLIKLLSEAAAYVPPGMSIHIMSMGANGGGACASGTGSGGIAHRDDPPEYRAPTDFAGLPPGHAAAPPGTCVGNPFATPYPPGSFVGQIHLVPIGTNLPGCDLNDKALWQSCAKNVPPPPTVLHRGMQHVSTTEEGETFGEFISAFRREMREARQHDARATRYVPSSAAAFPYTQRPMVTNCMTEVLAQPAQFLTGVVDDEEEDDYDYWPNFGLGVAQDDHADAASTTTTTSTTDEGSTLLTCRSTDEDSQDNLWPIELVVGHDR